MFLFERERGEGISFQKCLANEWKESTKGVSTSNAPCNKKYINIYTVCICKRRNFKHTKINKKLIY